MPEIVHGKLDAADASFAIVVSRFNRETGKWDALGARATVHFPLPPADAAVFRLATKPGAAIVKEPAVKWDPATNFAEAVKPAAARRQVHSNARPVR